jgi:endonuclease/exonuclease/phosphatase family metal-dependent hydrolase
MTESSSAFRIATYNIHKCRGMDRRILPARIIAVLREVDADILCLQEVVNAPETPSPANGLGAAEEASTFDQAGEIARAMPDYASAFGANRALHGGTYGNMTLTRLPLRAWRNHDISRQRREKRGVLETEILIGGTTMHVFNLHLGTGHMERRFQAKRLLGPAILSHLEFKGPRLVIGDLNEWTRGLTTRLLCKSFQTFRPRHAARFPRTYPGILPLLSLDHCYYEPPLALEETRLWRTRTALLASDHLPLIANFIVA